MIYLETMVLGLLQGLTEYLPISSSAHLILLPQMLGWHSPLLNSLSFEVALHFGTLLAVLVYFRQELIGISRATLLALKKPRAWREDPLAKLGWFIVLGTLPAIGLALVAKHALEAACRSPWVIAVWLIVFGGIMAAAEAWALKKKTLQQMTFWDAVGMGIAQALALLPGVSRSGSTLSAGLFLRFQRAEAARYSFLLSIPAILGAMVFNLKDLLGTMLDQSWPILVLGTLTAAVAGYACIRFLMAYLQKRTLYPFVIYRLLLGLAVFLWLSQHPR